jgi:hypothetical protein
MRITVFAQVAGSRLPSGAHQVVRAGVHLTPRLVLGLAAVCVVLAGGYWVSLRVRPHVTCRRCLGTGRVRGFFFAWARDVCRRCDGTGLVPRLGTYLGGSGRWAGPARGPYR